MEKNILKLIVIFSIIIIIVLSVFFIINNKTKNNLIINGDSNILENLEPKVDSTKCITPNGIDCSEVFVRDRNFSFKDYGNVYLYNQRLENLDVSLMNDNKDILFTWQLNMASIGFNYPLILSYGRLVFINLNDNSIGVVDNQSNEIWSKELSAHHDAELTLDNSGIITAVREVKFSETFSREVIDEQITILSVNDGEILDQFSVLEILDSDPEFNLKEKVNKVSEYANINESRYYHQSVYNLFHINTIEILRKDYNDIFKKGTALVSLRNINTIILLDLNQRKVLWSWGENDLDAMHSPTMTNRGTILVFDNGMNHRSYSRILEIDPISKEIIWSYNEKGDKDFHSNVMGCVQELPNQEILITESTKGRAFKIDREGNTVWEYTPFDTLQPEKSIYRFTRYSGECLEDIFNGIKEQTDCEE